jgi:hypothetical protein
MSITFTSRYDDTRNMSAVHSSRRCRVANPLRPGTRPSAARRSSVEADSAAGDGSATQPRQPPELDEDDEGGADDGAPDCDAGLDDAVPVSDDGAAVVVDGSWLPLMPGGGVELAHAANVTAAIVANAATESHRVTRRMPPPVRLVGPTGSSSLLSMR